METKGISGGPKAISPDDLNKNQMKQKKPAEQTFEQSDAVLFNAGASLSVTQFLGGTAEQNSEKRSIEGEAEARKLVDIAV